MPHMVVTLDVPKLSGWLKADDSSNMYSMDVTLDVSKLSGWLNADAYCRESEGRHIRCGARCLAWGGRVARAGRRCKPREQGRRLVRGEVRAAGAGWRERSRPKQRAGENPTADTALGAEHTWNMVAMVVTLDVSKLSGWLNADARRNICCMSVTLDVSKLNGWLNTNAE